jgi:hypothetical protein
MGEGHAGVTVELLHAEVAEEGKEGLQVSGILPLVSEGVGA